MPSFPVLLSILVLNLNEVLLLSPAGKSAINYTLALLRQCLVLFISIMQSTNEAQVLFIMLFLLFEAASVFVSSIVPLTSIYESL